MALGVRSDSGQGHHHQPQWIQVTPWMPALPSPNPTGLFSQTLGLSWYFSQLKHLNDPLLFFLRQPFKFYSSFKFTGKLQK